MMTYVIKMVIGCPEFLQIIQTAPWHVSECLYYVHYHHLIERGDNKGSDLFCKMSDCGLGLEGIGGGGGGGKFLYTFSLLLLDLLLLWLYRSLLGRVYKAEGCSPSPWPTTSIAFG